MVKKIVNSTWQLENGQIGQIVTGIDDIDQSINIILTTPVGSVPMNPEFGSLLHKYVDAPINDVAAQMVVEVIHVLRRWEKRITVDSVTVEADAENGAIVTTIAYTVIATNKTQTTQVIA